MTRDGNVQIDKILKRSNILIMVGISKICRKISEMRPDIIYGNNGLDTDLAPITDGLLKNNFVISDEPGIPAFVSCLQKLFLFKIDKSISIPTPTSEVILDNGFDRNRLTLMRYGKDGILGTNFHSFQFLKSGNLAKMRDWQPRPGHCSWPACGASCHSRSVGI